MVSCLTHSVQAGTGSRSAFYPIGAVGVATRLRAGRARNCGLIAGRALVPYLPHSVQTGAGSQSAFYPIGAVRFLLGGKVVGSGPNPWLRLVPKIVMRGAVSPFRHTPYCHDFNPAQGQFTFIFFPTAQKQRTVIAGLSSFQSVRLCHVIDQV
jgi:hypothetical protein